MTRGKEETCSDEFVKAQYWMSPEARILFGFDYNDSFNMVEGLNKRIELLKRINQSELGYELVLKMTVYSASSLNNHNIFNVQNKSLFLLCAYLIALTKTRTGLCG